MTSTPVRAVCVVAGQASRTYTTAAGPRPEGGEAGGHGAIPLGSALGIAGSAASASAARARDPRMCPCTGALPP